MGENGGGNDHGVLWHKVIAALARMEDPFEEDIHLNRDHGAPG